MQGFIIFTFKRGRKIMNGMVEKDYFIDFEDK